MTPHCGFTGCDQDAMRTCAWCALPLCQKHITTVKGDPRPYCRGCSRYLQAKAAGGETPTEGGADAS
jgi:hypothetical protein